MAKNTVSYTFNLPFSIHVISLTRWLILLTRNFSTDSTLVYLITDNDAEMAANNGTIMRIKKFTDDNFETLHKRLLTLAKRTVKEDSVLERDYALLSKAALARVSMEGVM